MSLSRRHGLTRCPVMLIGPAPGGNHSAVYAVSRPLSPLLSHSGRLLCGLRPEEGAMPAVAARCCPTDRVELTSAPARPWRFCLETAGAGERRLSLFVATWSK